MYTHRHTHINTDTHHNTHMCTCVGWFPVPLLTLLHTTWPFYWTLTLVYYTQRVRRRCLYLQFINTDVLCICNCNACCPEFIARSDRTIWHTSCVRFNLVAFISNDMPFRYRYVVLKTVASWEMIGSAFCRKETKSPQKIARYN
jgi:hypothetical protein